MVFDMKGLLLFLGLILDSDKQIYNPEPPKNWNLYFGRYIWEILIQKYKNIYFLAKLLNNSLSTSVAHSLVLKFNVSYLKHYFF